MEALPLHQRRVLLTIDTILEIFKSYLSAEDLPQNTIPVRLLFKPTEQGKLAILAESLQWREGLAPLQVNFDIKRIYTSV